MGRNLVGGCIDGGVREARCRGRKTSPQWQHGNRRIGSEGLTRLRAGGRVSEQWMRQGESNAPGRSPFPSGQNER